MNTETFLYSYMYTAYTMEPQTTIRISKTLSEKLRTLGSKGETYEQIIARLIMCETSKTQVLNEVPKLVQQYTPKPVELELL